MKKPKTLWRLLAKSLGKKASKCDKESDTIAIIRTFILTTYLITNAFIISGVIRHWNSREIIINVEVIEAQPTVPTIKITHNQPFE